MTHEATLCSYPQNFEAEGTEKNGKLDIQSDLAVLDNTTDKNYYDSRVQMKKHFSSEGSISNEDGSELKQNCETEVIELVSACPAEEGKAIYKGTSDGFAEAGNPGDDHESRDAFIFSEISGSKSGFLKDPCLSVGNVDCGSFKEKENNLKADAIYLANTEKVNVAPIAEANVDEGINDMHSSVIEHEKDVDEILDTPLAVGSTELKRIALKDHDTDLCTAEKSSPLQAEFERFVTAMDSSKDFSHEVVLETYTLRPEADVSVHDDNQAILENDAVEHIWDIRPQTMRDYDDVTKVFEELDQKNGNFWKFKATSDSHAPDVRELNIRETVRELNTGKTISDNRPKSLPCKKPYSVSTTVDSLCNDAPEFLVTVHVVVSEDTEMCITESVTIEANAEAVTREHSLTTCCQLLQEKAGQLSFEQSDYASQLIKNAYLNYIHQHDEAKGQFISISVPDGTPSIRTEKSGVTSAGSGSAEENNCQEIFEAPSFMTLVDQDHSRKRSVSFVDKQPIPDLSSSPITLQPVPPPPPSATSGFRGGMLGRANDERESATAAARPPLLSLSSLLGSSFNRDSGEMFAQNSGLVAKGHKRKAIAKMWKRSFVWCSSE